MRRRFHFVLSGWFALVMTMAQACVPPTQGTSAYRSGAYQPTTVGALGNTTPTSSSPEAAHIDTANYKADKNESRALTGYLQHHRLPLVGAQVLEGPDGQRAIVLYGFVGSDFGKGDAEAKTRSFIGDQSSVVDNRIKVRSELLASGADASGSNASAGAPDESAGSYPNAQDYTAQQNQAEAQIQQYQQQQGGNLASSVFPLLMLLGILGAGIAGGGGSYGSFGPPPYASSPYFPGYSSPYSPRPYGLGYPYGGPVGPFAPGPFGYP